MDMREEMEEKIVTDGMIKRVPINNVPSSFWEEFKKDAKDNFSDNYIMKIMIDHYRRVDGDKRVEELMDSYGLLEQRVRALEEQAFFNDATEEERLKRDTEKVIKGFGRKEE